MKKRSFSISDDARRHLMLASLPHVAFDGWSMKAVANGAKDLGWTPGQGQLLFPRRTKQLVETFSTWVQAEVARIYAKEAAPQRIRDKITRCITLRLEILEPHKPAVARLMNHLMRPGNMRQKHQLAYKAVDHMWRLIGDKSVDFSFYTKRAILAGVYGSTLLYWLNDESDNFENTRAFIDRRIENVMHIPKAKQKLKDMINWLPRPSYFFQSPKA